MPVYRYGCKQCEHEEDGYRSIDERHDSPICCGERMYIVICPAMGFVQGDVCYDSPITGQPITSHAARREDLKRTRSRPYEGLEQEKKEAERKRAYADQKHDAKLEDATRRAYHQLSPDKRRILEGR